MEKGQKVNEYFDQNPNFSENVNPVTMRFRNKSYELEYYKFKYERKNLLTIIGINIFFNMFIIGVRLILICFKGYDVLKPYSLPIYITLWQMIFWNGGLIIEAIIFFMPKLRLFRGFSITSLPLIGMIVPSIYITNTLYKTTGPYFPAQIIYYSMESFVSVLLYSANWICGAIQVLIYCAILTYGYASMPGNIITDIPTYIILTFSAAISIIITIYCFEYFQRKATFMRLEAERQRNNLKNILDAIPEPILISKTNQIKYTNSAYINILSKEDSESISNSEESKNVIDSISQNSNLNLEIKNEHNSVIGRLIDKDKNETLESIVNNGLKIDKREFEMRKDNGTKNYFEVTSVELNEGNDKLILYILINLTFFRQIKRSKDRAKYLLTYFASITHDFRTPLSIIMGNCEILFELINESQAKNHIQNIFNSCTIMSLLVQDILDYSQIKAGELDLIPLEFNLEKEFSLIIELFIDKYKSKNLFLRLSIEKNSPLVANNDGNRIKQILMNLISNAFKFTLNGGVQISISFSNHEDLFYVAVKDTGIGMTEAETLTLFKEFTKIKTHKHLNPNGIGLGLHICQRLTNRLGGKIFVKSIIGEGTTFTFSFKRNFENCYKNTEIAVNGNIDRSEYLSSSRGKPSNAYKIQSLLKTPKTLKEISLKKVCSCSKILIVDDDLGIRQILTHYAKTLNVRYDEASNGKMAIEKIKEKLANICCISYNIIFIDYYMPEMDGVEASIKIKEILSSTSNIQSNIILVSGLSFDEKKKINSLPLNPFTSIESKPLPKAKFIEIINKYIFK